MNKIFFLLLVTLSFFSHADDGKYYMTAGRAYATVDLPYSLTAATEATRISFGKEVHPNLDVEFMYLKGDGAADTTTAATNISYSIPVAPGVYIPQTTGVRAPLSGKLHQGFGVFLKPKFKISPDWVIFAKLGFTKVDASLASGDITCATNCTYFNQLKAASPDKFPSAQTIHYSQTGRAFGIGTGVKISESLELTLDHMKLSKIDGRNISATSVTLKYDF
jgi:hypothetical protein